MARPGRPARAVEVIDGTIRLVRPLSELGTPASVREVVSHRLSRLEPVTGSLLELPATVGSRFELDVVRRAAGLTEPELLAALDEAARSGMIEELPSRELSYRFTHELVRRALYDRLTGVKRAQLHRRVARRSRRRPEPTGARSPTWRTTSPPPPRWATPSAASSTTSWRRGRPPPRSRSTRRRSGCARRSSSRSRARPAGRRCCWSSVPPVTGRAGRSTR